MQHVFFRDQVLIKYLLETKRKDETYFGTKNIIKSVYYIELLKVTYSEVLHYKSGAFMIEIDKKALLWALGMGGSV